MIDFYRVKCTRVKDGDTFVGDITFGVFGMSLHDQVFRLYGVDTPERKQDLYFEATEFTAQHIEEKELIVFIYGKDSFGRWLVDVYIDGVHETLNSILLSEGLAKIYDK